MQSSFQTAVVECPDINASTMALNVSGRFAIIAGRKCMVLVDLDGGDLTNDTLDLDQSSSYFKTIKSTSQTSPHTSTLSPTCKRMARNTKYEPTASQFSRHAQDMYALTANQVIEVFSIEDLNPAKPKLTLKGHSRAVADIEWSHFDPNLLGSSAPDCLTNLWDVRDHRRPSTTLTSVSGATHVRFCKTSSNLLATSHEIDVRIWDIRQQNLPLYYIAAHLQKINGIDWMPPKSSSPICDNAAMTACDQNNLTMQRSSPLEQLITCSLDNTIKIWDVAGSKVKQVANFATRSPAWRIRYTPVSSNAIITSTLPQLKSRTECSALRLWSLKPNMYDQKKLELILGLVGHQDVIIDFDWRARNPQSTACEAVSWSMDQTLRVWRIDSQFIEMNVEDSDCETEGDATSVQHPDHLVGTPGAELISADRSASNLDYSVSSTATVSQSGKSLLSTLQDSVSDDKENRVEDSAISNFGLNQSGDITDLTDVAIATTNELKQEFSLINKNIPNIEFEELNALRRICLVTARVRNVLCRLKISLPPAYPHADCPTFTVLDESVTTLDALSQESKEKLLHLLDETAKSQQSRNRNCIEPCLRKFITALQKLTLHNSSYSSSASRSSSRRAASSQIDPKDDPITLSAQRDHSVPFPPTSGARFCGNLLVCFGRPMIPTLNPTTQPGSTSESSYTNWMVKTPRSMAQLSAQLDNMRRQGSYNLNHISISYFYYGAMRRAEMQLRAKAAVAGSTTPSSGVGSQSTATGASSSRSRTSSLLGSAGTGSNRYFASRSRSGMHAQSSIMSKSYKCGPVVVYDVSSIPGGISRELAENYVFDKDVINMCKRNAEIAAKHNRQDLVQIWSLAELSSEGVLRTYKHNDDTQTMGGINTYDADFGDRPWTMHPFGSKLIQSLIDHFVDNCRDVQTAAMLVWTFSSPKLGLLIRRDDAMLQVAGEGYDVNNDNAANKLSSASSPFTIKTPSQTSYSLTNTYQTVMTGLLSGSFKQQQQQQQQQPELSAQSNLDAISDEWNFVNGPYDSSSRNLYSSSWTQPAIHEHLSAESPQTIGANGLSHRGPLSANIDNSASASDPEAIVQRFLRLNILSAERALQNDLIMHVYAELLYRCNLLNQRAMVLKNVGSSPAYAELFGNKNSNARDKASPTEPGYTSVDMSAESRIPNLTIQCNNPICRAKCQSVQCANCKTYSFKCSVCRLPVKGSSAVCLKCLHGGHIMHYDTWFNSFEYCPTGCGCKCLLNI